MYEQSSPFGDEVDTAIALGVTPSEADVMLARELILEMLRERSDAEEQEFRESWLQRHDVEANLPTYMVLQSGPEVHGHRPPGDQRVHERSRDV